MNTARLFEICTSLVLLAGTAASAPAQTNEPQTRQTVIEEAQSQKVSTLRPYVPSKAERVIASLEDMLESPSETWHPYFENAYRAIVHTGEFSDPAVEQVLADIMIKRRDNPQDVPARGESDRLATALLEKLDGPMVQFGEHLMKGSKQEGIGSPDPPARCAACGARITHARKTALLKK